MNVTQEIRNANIRYGSSDNTAAYGLASSKSLDYAKGASIVNPAREAVIAAPHKAAYADSLGLFGVENLFIQYHVRLIYSSLTTDTGNQTADVDGYFAVATTGAPYTASEYPGCPLTEHPQPHPGGTCTPPVDSDGNDVLGWWPGLDVPESVAVNDFLPAVVTNDLVKEWDSMCLVDLENLKTGNTYNDSWLDIRLYNKYKEEHPYDQMWISYDDSFYLGVHARNTRRIPYNILCTIGSKLGKYSNFTPEQKAMTARGSQP